MLVINRQLPFIGIIVAIGLSYVMSQFYRTSNGVIIKELAQEVVFVPENASADKALRLLLAQQSQLVVVADEFGSTVGVLAMEDIIESILGQEIFEHDDVAVDMRELARRKSNVIEEGEIAASSLPEPSPKET